MNSGLYTAYSGMKSQSDALEVLANNMANINTTGFKEEKVFYSMLNQSLNATENATGKPPENMESVINRTVMAGSSLNQTEGSLLSTKRDLDIAITGQGFLAVQTPQGIRFTRNGNLQINAKSVLTTSEGFPVIGVTNKPITLGTGKIDISLDGSVTLDKNPVDRLKIVTFDNLSELEKQGSSMFVHRGKPETQKVSDATIQSGCLEQSNVNAVASVVQMVEVMRHFEAIQKCVNSLMNDINAKVIDKLGS
jgi:flagellar basal-body rod protein FlgF